MFINVKINSVSEREREGEREREREREKSSFKCFVKRFDTKVVVRNV